MSTQTGPKKRPKRSSDPTLPPGAVQFLFEALEHAVNHVHGPPSKLLRKVADWLIENNIEFVDLKQRFRKRELPPEILQSIRKLGGTVVFNRHVSGEQLCDGIRRLALKKWGLMATTVLARWNIRATADIGRLVFALVESGRLQKTRDDRIEAFNDLFDFTEAFDRSYEISMSRESTPADPEC